MKGWYSAGLLPLLAAGAVWLPPACEKRADDPQQPAGQAPPVASLTPDQALIYHAAHGNAGGVAQALDNGADIEARDENGLTPLMWASQQEVAAVVSLLLQRGANPYLADRSGWTALHCAASNGSVDGMQELLKACRDGMDTVNKDGETPLLLAIRMHREEIARALMAAGADVRASNNEGQNSLDVARSEKLHDLVVELHNMGAYPHKDRALLDMARDGRMDRMKVFFENNPDAVADVRDENGMTPLMFAAATGHTECAEMLLDAGADVNARDNVGMTPLLFAALEGRMDALKLLLAKGADMQASTKGGWTPLLLAVGHRHTGMAQFLLHSGANVNAANIEGATPLHVAATNNHCEMVELLIVHGASLETEDSYGWTPLMVAAAYGHASVVKLLLQAGASVDHRDENEWSAVHCAASAGSVGALRLLAERGADIAAMNQNRRTALSIASGLGYLDMVRYLVEERRLPLNEGDYQGWTPLMHAAALGQESVVDYLLDKGADATLKNMSGETARKLAEQRGQHTVLNVFDGVGISE